MIGINLQTKGEISELTQKLSLQLYQYSLGQRPIHIALSGGSTPKAWFQSILKSEFRHKINWSQLHFWWGDERCVSLDSEQSNAGEALRLLLSKVPAHLHLVQGTLQAKAAAQDLIQQMKIHLVWENEVPIFDWIILGIGTDGHTASLFPKTSYPSLRAHPAQHPQSAQWRVSLDLQTLIHARKLSFLCTGSDKAPILQAIFNTESHTQHWPAAQVFAARPDCDFFIDKQANPFLKHTKDME